MSSHEETKSSQIDEGARRPYRVRLPGFVGDEDIGLGDVIKRVTYAVGVTPCGGCERRAAALNRRFVFTGRATYATSTNRR